jgi:hypothetical protein
MLPSSLPDLSRVGLAGLADATATEAPLPYTATQAGYPAAKTLTFVYPSLTAFLADLWLSFQVKPPQ